MCLYLDLSWDSICGEVITSQGSAPLIKQTDSNYTREIKVYRPNRDKFNDHSKFYGTISIIKVVLDVDIYMMAPISLKFMERNIKCPFVLYVYTIQMGQDKTILIFVFRDIERAFICLHNENYFTNYVDFNNV